MKPRQNRRGFLSPGLDLAGLVSAERRDVAGKVFLFSSRYLTPKKEKDMGQGISKLTIKGYKSIRSLENFELRNLNILIGPNGSGKSNFVSFFCFLKAISKHSLGSFVTQQGGANRLLYFGSHKLIGKVIVVDLSYEFQFHPSVNNTLFFHREDFSLEHRRGLGSTWSDKTGLTESSIFLKSADKESENYVEEIRERFVSTISKIEVYHFHNTSDFAAVKRPCSKRDYDYLRPDASNLAAFLLFLKKKHEREYQNIRETIQLAAPFFDDFLLRDSLDNPDETLLEWQQKNSDYPFHPSQISDGTLRFICLATALLQPNPPSTIILDEPELGLHPLALALLAELIKKASLKTQVIAATQSAGLISQFDPQDIIVVERKNEESVFRRLPLEKLKQWIDDYSLGELWEMNLLEERPENE